MYCKLSDSFYGSHGAHFFCNLHFTDEGFNIFVVEEDFTLFSCRVELELKVNVFQGFVNIGKGEEVGLVANEIERDGAVHGASIDEGIIEGFGKLSGQCTFSAAAEAVDGDGDFFEHEPANFGIFWEIPDQDGNLGVGWQPTLIMNRMNSVCYLKSSILVICFNL